MLSILGFATIAIFLLLIITKRVSVITALVLVPLLFGFLAGFNVKELGEMMLTGIKQVAPTGILLMFAVLYFATMLEAIYFQMGFWHYHCSTFNGVDSYIAPQ